MACPRWVLAPHVDSTAMLSAVLWFKTKDPDTWQALDLQDHLNLVEHAIPSIGTTTRVDGIPAVMCPLAKDQCWRCSRGRSGYTFRWLSVFWASKYNELRQRNAWAPGDQEGDVEWKGLCPSHFTGQLTTAQGHLLQESERVRDPPILAASSQDLGMESHQWP